MSKKYQSAGILALFLVLIAGAFTGSLPETYGYSTECTDDMDNDLDGFIDVADESCFQYPFEDGNGETDTPLNERYTGENYLSLFEYHLNYASSPSEAEAAICSALGFGYYNSEDAQTASSWVDSNNVDCSPYLP